MITQDGQEALMRLKFGLASAIALIAIGGIISGGTADFTLQLGLAIVGFFAGALLLVNHH